MLGRADMTTVADALERLAERIREGGTVEGVCEYETTMDMMRGCVEHRVLVVTQGLEVAGVTSVDEA